MKVTLSLVLLATICALQNAKAQDFPGLRTGNYSGVNGAFSNPANIAASPYRFDLNLFSAHVLAGNDQASFKMKDLTSSISGDSFSDQVFGKNAGAANGLANISLNLPSVMFNAGPKMSFALTSRARVLANINSLNGKLVNKITEDFENDPELPYTVASNDNMLVNISGWSEFGLTAAREVFNSAGKRLRAGITVKYLAGIANSYVNIGKLNGTINADNVLQDAYLNNTTGRLALGFSGVNFSDFEAGDLTKFNGSGVGADIGLVYEWKSTKGIADSADMKLGRNRPGYKFRLGISLLDAGKISFTRDVNRSGAYDIAINSPGERYYFSQLEDVDLDSYKSKFNSQPNAFTPVAGESEGKYSVSLPTTLQIDADYHVAKMLYINAGGQLALSSNSSTVYNGQYYNSFTLTPRIETSVFGLFLPVNFNALTETNIGVGVRMGPLTLGSGSLISALTGSSKQADIFLGLHIGILKNKYDKFAPGR
ncbi:DUF5723 family protein [Hufsiella ginkgonis]|uniref:DUF5723 domain-containing protein n=1 Tax=Hufsiella ginkgonis TaxID=2695274 RepID=A0A7K1XUC6_9SPHI|nr:DUF5723 family protein [Hufsiella ginkgonis]MXV14615.1 hypothetical protein [Hufsiella ginkgonis]